MTTLSTHDTKRSEDVRARLAVLAEMPRRVDRRACGAGRRATRCPTARWTCWPGRTLVGAWPIAGDRLAGYLDEGARRRPSSSPATSRPCRTVVRGGRARGPPRCSPTPSWRPRSSAFVARISRPGWSNSLGQKLVQLAGPGRARRLPGHRAVGVLAGRPGQPPAGRLRRAPRPARPARRRLAARRRRRRARRSCWSPRARCGCAGTGRSCSPATGRCPPTGPAAAHAVAFAARRRRWSRWPPGCRSGWPPRRLGRHGAALPDGAGTGTTCSPDAAVDGAAPAAGATCWRATRWRCWSAGEGGSARD